MPNQNIRRRRRGEGIEKDWASLLNVNEAVWMINLQACNKNVDDPQQEKEAAGNNIVDKRSADLSSEGKPLAEDDNERGDAEDGEDKNIEAQGPGLHHKRSRLLILLEPAPFLVLQPPLVVRSSHRPLDSSAQPGDAETEKDVDAVASRHVPQRVVGRVVHLDRDHGSEGVRQRSAEGNDGDGSDRLLQPHKAAEDGSEVSYHGSDAANQAEGNEEAVPSSSEVRGGDKGSHKLPGASEDENADFVDGRLGPVSILVDLESSHKLIFP
mmetsp:Transcript_46235/g.145008  ORF Transcript_46235/g.145008 Transcript_46235/m.145008 type:complete len:268 (+) Transcript_46235:229-1032(+)